MISNNDLRDLLEEINKTSNNLTVRQPEQLDIEKIIIEYEFSKAAEKYEMLGKYYKLYADILKDKEIENILF